MTRKSTIALSRLLRSTGLPCHRAKRDACPCHSATDLLADWFPCPDPALTRLPSCLARRLSCAQRQQVGTWTTSRQERHAPESAGPARPGEISRRPSERFWPYVELAESPSRRGAGRARSRTCSTALVAAGRPARSRSRSCSRRSTRRTTRGRSSWRGSRPSTAGGTGDCSATARASSRATSPRSSELWQARRRFRLRARCSSTIGPCRTPGSSGCRLMRFLVRALSRPGPRPPCLRLSEFERDIRMLEAELRTLELEYNMFFAGRLPKPPWESARPRRGARQALRSRATSTSYAERLPVPARCSRGTRRSSICGTAGLRAREEGRPGPFLKPRQRPAEGRRRRCEAAGPDRPRRDRCRPDRARSASSRSSTSGSSMRGREVGRGAVPVPPVRAARAGAGARSCSRPGAARLRSGWRCGTGR